MTRTTVYLGTERDADPKILADVYHDHEISRPVIVKTTGGQEFRIPESEAVDIYIAGEEVPEDA